MLFLRYSHRTVHGKKTNHSSPRMSLSILLFLMTYHPICLASIVSPYLFSNFLCIRVLKTWINTLMGGLKSLLNDIYAGLLDEFSKEVISNFMVATKTGYPKTTTTNPFAISSHLVSLKSTG